MRMLKKCINQSYFYRFYIAINLYESICGCAKNDNIIEAMFQSALLNGLTK